MATAKSTTAKALPPYRASPNDELTRLLAECQQLRTEGQRIRVNTKRLRLDCVKARLDLAERLATFAHANSQSAKTANFFRNKALETYAGLMQSISNPGWTGMDRQALETRFAKLHSLFVDLKFCEPDTGIDHCPDTAQLAEPPAEKKPLANIGGNGHSTDQLTKRESEVLRCIAEGHSTKQVGGLLGITFKTAACHRYRIMDKLAIHDTATLVRYAIRIGLVQP